VCQNNGWAISQPIAAYVAGSVAARASGYGLWGACVDGNDIDAVRSVVAECVARARSGGGPSLIEARTWRWRGHWAGDDQAYRPAALEPPGTEDPVDLYADRLLESGTDLSEPKRVHGHVDAEVAQAMQPASAV